jgi:hypothetical protein
MPTFAVEAYQTSGNATALAAAAALAENGTTTRFRWSLVLPDEDLVFHVVDGASPQLVQEAAVRAQLSCQRISRALLISSEDVGAYRSLGGRR